MRPAFDHEMSWEEYLTFEKTSEVEHEFHDGRLYAMTGVRRIHAELSARLCVALRAHLRGRPCQAYQSDFKVYVAEAARGLYPDVVVSCDEAAANDDYYTTNAPLVIEVLSPSTEAYDRGAKFGYYRALPSLREYVLVDTENVRIDLFRRLDSGAWEIAAFEGTGTISLQSIGLDLDVADLYEGLDVPRPS